MIVIEQLDDNNVRVYRDDSILAEYIFDVDSSEECITGLSQSLDSPSFGVVVRQAYE